MWMCLLQSKELLLWVLHFTTLLIEHSFSRHLYNSVEHLLTLMSSCDLHVVLGVLNLLYMFSKRSNFLTRLLPEMRAALLTCLTYLAEVSLFYGFVKIYFIMLFHHELIISPCVYSPWKNGSFLYSLVIQAWSVGLIQGL